MALATAFPLIVLAVTDDLAFPLIKVGLFLVPPPMVWSTVQGVFGLMLGVLSVRYRNVWVIIGIHAVAHLVYVDLRLR